MKICKSVWKIREILLLVIVASLALWGCAPGAPTAALDEDAPNFIDPLPSPSPTWTAPVPDDEDPIVDCALDAPLCVIDVAVVDVAGEAYLGVDLQVVPIPGKWQPDGGDNVLLDVNVSVQRDGETVAEINVEGHSVAVAPAQGGIILTQDDGAPLLRIDSSELGLLLADPRPSPSLATAYDPSTQELLLLDAEGNPIATISAGGIGVLLADPRPSPVFLIPFDPSTSGFQILGSEGDPLAGIDPKDDPAANVDPKDSGVIIRDAEGNPVAAVDPKDGGVTIHDAAGNTVAIVDPKDDGVVIRDAGGNPVANIDPKDGGVVIRNAGGDPVMVIVPEEIYDAFGASGDLPAGQGGVSLIFLDTQGDPTSGVGLVDGLIVIAAPGIGPVAAIDPKDNPASSVDPKVDPVAGIDPKVDPAAGIDPKDTGLQITMLIPIDVASGETYDLVGTISVFGETSTGERVEFGRGSVDLKDPEKAPAPSPTPTTSGGKATATFAAPKPTATPAAPKPTATTAPPKPTAKPTDDGGKPSPTPGK